ncbi:MAG: pre-peptidase C-terminal domain-containing protein [Planctomycetaceae bacterium]|nr:pre-peptidase C-terminal domain-containing protein [Planctomycetaceae bacterium]
MLLPGYGARWGVCIAAVLIFASRTVRAEAPAATGLFPAGIQAGQNATVTLIGKSGSEPLEVWTSNDDVVLRPTDKSSEWILTAAADAPPGLRWVRLFNAEGASKRLPVMVGSVNEMTEVEPNDAVPEAHDVALLPTTINGKLAKSGDVDTFAVPLTAGQTLIASVDAHRLLGSPMAPVLQLLSPRGFVIEQNDDHHGNDPRIVFTALQTGTHYLRLFAFPSDPNSTIAFAGGDAYVYRLTLTTGPFVDHMAPPSLSREHNAASSVRGWNLPEDAAGLFSVDANRRFPLTIVVPTSLVSERFEVVDIPSLSEEAVTAATNEAPLSAPFSVMGTITEPKEIDVYSLNGQKGQTLVLTAEARRFDSPLDPLVKVFAPDGKLLNEADDVSASDNDARLTLTLPDDGLYRVEVHDRFRHGDPWSVYLLTIREDVPRYELSLPDDPLTLEAGKSLDVAVAVNRLGGFAQEIAIRVHGLPSGVQVKEGKSLPSGDSAKSVTLKLESTDDVRFSGPLRVTGTLLSGETVRATTSAPTAGLRMEDLWITVTAPAK